MAIKLAQTKTGTSTLASTVIAFDNNVVAGNLIMVAVATNLSTDVSGITDTLGNVYVNAFVVNGTGIEAELWYAKNVLGGANTVTIAYTSAPTASAIIREYSGVDTVTVLDQAKTATGNSSTLDSGTSTRINQNLELLIGVGAAVSATFTAGGSFVNLAQQANATIDIGIEDLFVTSTGTYNATFGASGSIQWACGVASFRQSPPGTTTSTSSTSSTTISTSSTSSSTSISSTSFSSTSASQSSTSSSISTSSTSSSVSSTSSSISSTSSSSTSSSTSVSSTSSSVSSTSMSSTSFSSTSSSTSISSTSSSFSSTSSSISSTSASTSSTSFSSTSSSSSTSTTAIPLNLDYTYQDPAPAWSYIIGSSATGSQVSGGTTATVTSGTVLSAGARIIVFIEIHNGVSNSVSSVTDTLGNSYTQDKTTNFGAGVVYGAIYSATNKAQGKPVITANFTALSSGFAVMATSSYNGVDGSTVDQSSSATGTSANASTTTPVTTGYNQLVIGAYFDDGNADATLTRGADFNLRGSFVNNANTEIILEDKNSSLPETVTSKVVSAAGNWGMLCVVYKLSSGRPTTGADLINRFTNSQVSDVTGDDGDYFIEYGSEYMIRNYQFDNTNNTDTPIFTWRGRSTVDTRVSPMLIQIYNVSSAAWETLATANRIPADLDFSVTVSQTTNISNYYDSNNIVTFRSYQQVI